MKPESIKVLIADDTPQVRQGIAVMLELASKNSKPAVVVIGEACNGQVAVEQAGELQPDVILMDLEMPVLDGFSATRRIKSEHPSISIIILTIHDDPASRNDAAQAGADIFIPKSSPPELIVRTIQDLLGSDIGIRSTNGHPNPE